MDRITKFLRQLNTKELELVNQTLQRIRNGEFENLNIKKLRGFDDIYRARIRDLRIIYRQSESEIRLIDIGRRSEKTYRDF